MKTILTFNVSFQVFIALRYYASGCFQREIGDIHGVHQTSVSRIIQNVSTAIASLSSEFIKFPSPEECEIIKHEFATTCGFPGVIGLIDGTHIRISNPGGENGEIYRNRKRYFSINTQIICDSNNKITDIVARWPGSTHDARILSNSRICALLENRDYGSHLLGDQGYPCRRFLLTPCLPRSAAESRYNAAHKKTRSAIERLFGMWKRRFPCLSVGMRLSPERCVVVIVACAVLHNFSISQSDFDSDLQVNDDDGIQENANADNDAQGHVKRQMIIQNHFQ